MDVNDLLWQDIGKWAKKNNDESVALSHLANGNPICYTEDDTPEECIIKEYPNGKKELITEGNNREIIIVKTYD